MPTDGFEAALRMVLAFGLVAAVAVPVGLFAWWFGRRAESPVLPVPTADDPVVALGYVVLLLAHPVGVVLLGQMAGAAALPERVGVVEPDVMGVWRSLFGTLCVAPVLLAVWFAFRTASGATGAWRASARAVGVGVAGWLLASPPVYSVHVAAERVSALVGVEPQQHPLVKSVADADGTRAALLVAAVCVATPFAEEVLFRGLLLGWLIRRPMWTFVPVGLAAVLSFGSNARVLAAGFLVILLAGLVAVRRQPTVSAVWATATLFATVHAGVWPTPVPLFLLGLALGVVTVRTGGVLAGTMLHGLFNAVSLVYLLRG